MDHDSKNEIQKSWPQYCSWWHNGTMHYQDINIFLRQIFYWFLIFKNILKDFLALLLVIIHTYPKYLLILVNYIENMTRWHFYISKDNLMSHYFMSHKIFNINKDNLLKYHRHHTSFIKIKQIQYLFHLKYREFL